MKRWISFLIVLSVMVTSVFPALQVYAADHVVTSGRETSTQGVIVGVELEESSARVRKGKTYQIKAKALYADGSTDSEVDFIYEVRSGKLKVTVDENGLITTLKVGESKIRVYTPDKEYYAEFILTIHNDPIPVEGVTFPESHVTIKRYETYQLMPIIIPADATVQKVYYTSSNENVAVVGGRGLVRPKGFGTTTITVVTEDGGFTAKCKVTVAQTYFDVTDFGADGTDKVSDYSAINKCLKYAKEIKEPITVYVPAGVYYINTALLIYSDTKLILHDDAIIRRESGVENKNMLRSAAEYEVIPATDPGGYTHCSNVEVSGGTWDGNVDKSQSSNTFFFIHAENITIKDTVIRNNCGAHLIEMCGVKDATISNVELYGFYGTAGNGHMEYKEAIQISVCAEGGDAVMMPYDNTACDNVIIENCKIHDYMVGVGSHQRISKVFHKNIQILNNEFYNITNACVNLPNFKKVVVKGNTATAFSSFLCAKNSSGKILNNTLYNQMFTRESDKNIYSEDCLFISQNSKFTVKNNKIANSLASGIRVRLDSNVKLINNSLTNNSLYGIQVENSTATMVNNKIKSSGEAMYYATKRAIIVADDVRAYYIDIKPKYKFTGKKIKPVIKLNGLRQGVDYKITYKNNKKRGTATVIITGIGKVKGQVIKTFEIY